MIVDLKQSEYGGWFYTVEIDGKNIMTSICDYRTVDECEIEAIKYVELNSNLNK